MGAPAPLYHGAQLDLVLPTRTIVRLVQITEPPSGLLYGGKMDVAPTHNTALPWKPDGSVCPTCGGPGRHSVRYPAAVCHDCETSVVDGLGKTVKLYNQSMSGGLLIVSDEAQLMGAPAEREPLFIKGIECRAREHRLGGVVLQPVEAWNASENF
jgi:hypothetical protein